MDYSVYYIECYYDVNSLQDSTEIQLTHYLTRDEFLRGHNEFGRPIGRRKPALISRNVPYQYLYLPLQK